MVALLSVFTAAVALAVARVRVLGYGSGVGRVAVGGRLRVDEALQFPSVEKDPPAFCALVDVDTAAFIGPHRSLALRASKVGDGLAHLNPPHRYGHRRRDRTAWCCPSGRIDRPGALPAPNITSP